MLPLCRLAPPCYSPSDVQDSIFLSSTPPPSCFPTLTCRIFHQRRSIFYPTVNRSSIWKMAPPPLLLLLLVPLLAAGRADTWGKEAHIMVCKIAEEQDWWRHPWNECEMENLSGFYINSIILVQTAS